MKRPETSERLSFSVLTWLEALSMVAALLWLLTAGLFSSSDD